MLTCGILMAHYTWYNLSPQSKNVTAVAFQTFGYGIEAFVFGYLGLTFFSYMDYDWSRQLIITEIIIVCLGRLVSTIAIIKVPAYYFQF